MSLRKFNGTFELDGYEDWNALVDSLRPVLPGLDIALTEVDLEAVYAAHSVDKLAWGNVGWNQGIALDITNRDFFCFFPKSPTAADDKESLLLKINELGQIVATRKATDRRYQKGIVANNGKLYALEIPKSDDTGNFRLDELSKTDLSLIQNIISIPVADLNLIQGIAKVSETILCLTGGFWTGAAGSSYTKYVKIDVDAKTYTIYSLGIGTGRASGRGVKSGDYLYLDQYQRSQGNFKINLSDFTWSYMGTPPSSLYDLLPHFKYGTKIFHGGAGGGNRENPQPMYMYDVGTEAWTQITEHPYGDAYPGTHHCVYFPLLEKALVQRGTTRYWNTPADQFILDVANFKWYKISHLFDLVCVPYNTAVSTDAVVHPIRLSGVAGSGVCIDGYQHEVTGEGPQGYYKDGFYVFLLPLWHMFYDTAERSLLKYVFGIVRAA